MQERVILALKRHVYSCIVLGVAINSEHYCEQPKRI